jgi:hypothetical protein
LSKAAGSPEISQLVEAEGLARGEDVRDQATAENLSAGGAIAQAPRSYDGSAEVASIAAQNFAQMNSDPNLEASAAGRASRILLDRNRAADRVGRG